MSSHWEEFYAASPASADFEENRKKIKDFCTKHDKANQKIVLITSGGTTVPLEHNTVRFVDNFSAGTRGSSSAEYFLEKGFAVLFLFRLKSLEPYVRHFVGSKFLDMLEIQNSPKKSIIDGLRTWLLNSKPRDFYKRGINKLPQHWKNVVNSEGEYIVD